MDIIRKLRKEKKITQEALAAAMQVSRSTIAMWETSGSRPKQDSLKKLADYFDVSADYLLGLTPCRARGEQVEEGILAKTAAEYAPALPLPEEEAREETQRIPILGRVAAGLPLYAEQNIEGYTFTERRGKNRYFALRVKGDSMNAARIFDGDIIIVRRQNMVEDGEIAVVMVDGEATVKRFYQEGSRVVLIPQSENKIHKPQIYDLHDHEVHILGKVVEIKIEVE